MNNRRVALRFFMIVLLATLVASFAFAGGKQESKSSSAPTTAAAKTSVGPIPQRFSLSDIPNITNKRPINMIVETGGTWDKILPYIHEFTKKTGVPVTVARVPSSGVYSKENLELVSGTGYYDTTYVETSTTNEWAPYEVPLVDLAKKYDPWGVAGLKAELGHFSPVLMRAASTREGVVMEIPFYTYEIGMFYRQDVFDNATEKASFQKEFGYPLAPATTTRQLLDQAKFFTRKKGDLLMGVPLTHDIHGLAMMEGAYQINDEITSRLWPTGADYATVQRDSNGNVNGYVITKKDTAALTQVLKDYVEETHYASAGDMTANFDFPSAELGDGRSIIEPTQFADLFVYTADLLKNHLPNAKLGVAPSIGKQPYTGAWSLGVAKASKNQEAAYWLVRYLGSYQTEMVCEKEGGQVATRVDVLQDPSWYTSENEYPFGILHKYLINVWNYQKQFVNNYFYFNSTAAGRIYDMQIYTLNHVISGTPVSAVVKELDTKTVQMQNQFGKFKMTQQ